MFPYFILWSMTVLTVLVPLKIEKGKYVPLQKIGRFGLVETGHLRLLHSCIIRPSSCLNLSTMYFNFQLLACPSTFETPEKKWNRIVFQRVNKNKTKSKMSKYYDLAHSVHDRWFSEIIVTSNINCRTLVK